MKYSKPPLSFDQQTELLLSRGLNADRPQLVQVLQQVSYYRLSGYLYPFRLKNDRFLPGTNFQTIWQTYRFDRHLRLTLLDAIERVEIAVRAQLTYRFAFEFGPFGYTDPSAFPRFKYPEDHSRWLMDLTSELRRSRETFIKHFKSKYGDEHQYPPLWMLTEVFSLGRLLTMFTGVHDRIRKETASFFGADDRVLESWLRTLNGVRNIAAHHGRLWNRTLGYKPLLPNTRKYPQWENIPNEKLFVVVLILRHLMCICAPKSHWPQRVESLLAEYPDISLFSMGFPDNWQQQPIWNCK